MIVIPAIDIRGGKVVRLTQGSVKKETVYPDSPLDFAKKWDSAEVELIHIVDLDGAIEGRLKNFETVKSIVKNIRAKVELGGGIRDVDTIKKVLDAGIDKAVIGTRALDERFLKEIERSPLKDRIVIAIDAKEGIVHGKGWVASTAVKVVELAKRVEGFGFRRINYTDIRRDGTLEGPNIEGLKELLGATKMEVVAGGGISGLDDLRSLKRLEDDGLVGVILGKSLYENKIDLKKAIRICSQKG